MEKNNQRDTRQRSSLEQLSEVENQLINHYQNLHSKQLKKSKKIIPVPRKLLEDVHEIAELLSDIDQCSSNWFSELEIAIFYSLPQDMVCSKIEHYLSYAHPLEKSHFIREHDGKREIYFPIAASIARTLALFRQTYVWRMDLSKAEFGARKASLSELDFFQK